MNSPFVAPCAIPPAETKSDVCADVSTEASSTVAAPGPAQASRVPSGVVNGMGVDLSGCRQVVERAKKKSIGASTASKILPNLYSLHQQYDTCQSDEARGALGAEINKLRLQLDEIDLRFDNVMQRVVPSTPWPQRVVLFKKAASLAEKLAEEAEDIQSLGQLVLTAYEAMGKLEADYDAKIEAKLKDVRMVDKNGEPDLRLQKLSEKRGSRRAAWPGAPRLPLGLASWEPLLTEAGR